MHLCKERNQEAMLMKVGEAKKDKRKCDYCLRTGHTKEKCWRLHGLGGENGNFMSHAYFLETTESSSQSGDTSVKGFSMEEFQALRGLITQLKSPTTILLLLLPFKYSCKRL